MATAAEKVDFNHQVRPILSANCIACHGPDEAAREAKLRLDTFDGATAARKGPSALVPGKPDESELVQRIESTDPDEVMPPPKSGHALKAEEIALLRQWIREGGTYDEHWAFVAPKKELPEGVTVAKAPAVIDAWVDHGLQQKGLARSPQAKSAALMRRVALDVTGLPMTPEQVQAFAADPSAATYEAAVDRLLVSPRFGEHWARMWLDLARYADTMGYEKDKHRPIWRYRDWVIDAFNRDLPYDQFTIEQLAGDLLPNRTNDNILATAFHRNTMTNEEGGTDNEEFRVAAVKDRVDTTIQVWMGLTMGCAKCHTHKYDPLSIQDYYSFYALFNQTKDNDQEQPVWHTPTKEQAARDADLKAKLKSAESAVSARPPAFTTAYEKWRDEQGVEAVWMRLDMASFESKAGATVKQDKEKRLIGTGKAPKKDVWTVTFALPSAVAGKPLTSLRIDHFPKSVAGGDWPDNNVALRELTVTHVVDGISQKVKLKQPRTTFQQRGWPVAKAIDGKPDRGWAISPKFKERQAAIFDFAQPLDGGSLVVELEQQYGQALVLARSAFSVSRLNPKWLKTTLNPSLDEVYAVHVNTVTSAAYKEVEKLKREIAANWKQVPQTPVMFELEPNKLRKTHLHKGGNFLSPGELVEPKVLTRFSPMPDGAPLNRLGAAKWLMDEKNPLTARVMVNRIWARLFGIGLVETEEDFGMQGQMPSHTELLDWLAVDFREQGWSFKQLIRSIVLSKTYQQSAASSPEGLAADPRNRLYGRGPRFRLSAEQVRDQALFVSGLLHERIGGPSVMPPQPPGIWKTTYSGSNWVNAKGPDRFRRGVYTYLKRTSPYPAFSTFDAGTGEVCQIRRIRTNTPLQALITLNDVVYMEAASGLAGRMKAAGNASEAWIRAGFEMVLMRAPADQELQRLVDLYDSLEGQLDDEKALVAFAGGKADDARLIAVASVILNLDETIMKP